MSIVIDTLRIKDEDVLTNIRIVKEMIRIKLIYPVPPPGDRGQESLN